MQISRPTGPSATPLSQPAVASRGAQASLAVSLPALPRARAVAPVETCSPDGRIRCVVRFSPSLAYSVIVDGRPVLAGGQLDLVTREYGGVGTPARPLGVSRRSVNRTVRPAQALWASAIPDRFEETSLRLTPTLSLEVRVANDGVALRFRGHADGPVTVTGETFTLPFNDAAEMRAMMPNALESPLAGDAYHDSYEHPFTRRRVGDVTSFRLAQMPAVFRCNDHWVGVSEAQVLGYPGSWMKRVPEGGFMLDAPGAPKRTKVTEALKFWRVETVTERHAHLVESNEGTRVYPWRVLQVGRSLADLVGRDFMARLADESIAAAAAEDFSWVPPHVTATDEWMIEAKPSLDPAKVGFTPGLNTPTYKYYVDFAARAGLSHIIVDDGWCDASDWTKRNPALDLEEVIRYGKQKGVGVLLWAQHTAVSRDIAASLDFFAKLGVSGVKVDFMNRDDAAMHRFMETFAAAAARHRLLVSYHGVGKPTGLHLRYPNVVGWEAALSHEFNGWSRTVSPQHRIDLATIRSYAPFDYEGGSMLNAQPETFVATRPRVQAQGTRANELATRLAYPGVLQVFGGDPAQVEADPAMLDFYTRLPATWCESRVLHVDDSTFAVAKRSGDTWYLAVLAAGPARSLELDTSFLTGAVRMTAIEDGPDADTKAADYRRTSSTLYPGTPLTVKLARNGGFVAKLGPLNQR